MVYSRVPDILIVAEDVSHGKPALAHVNLCWGGTDLFLNTGPIHTFLVHRNAVSVPNDVSRKCSS
jgi:hypothetical protein